MNIINGREISEKISQELKIQIDELRSKNIIPSIVIIQIGNNQASNVYVRNKLKLCEKLAVNGKLKHLEENIAEIELIKLIKNLNDDKNVNGILVQLPLPGHIDENKIIETINPIKDVDCFHLENVGKIWTAKKRFKGILPCTPDGIIEILKRSHIEMEGKNVVILGRSNIVGKPLAALFLLENATVTICHSKTNNLINICSRADVLVAAIGKAKFITKAYTNNHQIIVDVGMNRDENNKLCGDVDFENVKDCVYAISPVPGGVGPMTIVMLIKNLISATKLQNDKK